MAESLEKQLEQVRLIRRLRVRSRLRDQQAQAMAVQAAQDFLDKAERLVLDREMHAVTLQRDGMKDLVDDSVTVQDLLKFNKRKIRSLKQIKDAKRSVFEQHREKMLAIEVLQERIRQTKKAEKKLMGIDEVIAGQLWK
jgi:hypothetical protein